MKVKQALIACGGNGSRLRKSGMEVPLAKSFIEFEGKPMLYWRVLGLYFAGIEKLIFTAETDEKIKKIKQVIADFPVEFSEIEIYKNSGLGFTGLPYQVRHLLDNNFFFVCGHSVSEPEHYNRLNNKLQNRDFIVVSGYKPKANKKCPCINEFLIDSPYLFNKDCANKLPELGYNIHNVVEFYNNKGLLKIVQSNLPLEVDFIEEWNEAVPFYKSYVKKLNALL